MIQTKDLEQHNTFLVVVNVSRLRDELYSLIEYTGGLNLFRVVINVNIPFNRVLENIKKEEDIIFVDCIISSTSLEMITGDFGKRKAHLLGYPDLEAISRTLNNILKLAEGRHKAVIIESLSTFLIYNPLEDVVNFIRGLISKNDPSLKVFAITPDEKDKFLVEKLGPFFDKTIVV